MSSDDLAAIRAKRMEELKAGNATSSNNDNEKANEQQELMKNTILKQALEQAALARLNNLLVAKPDKGRIVENMILQMARGGQIPRKLSDDDLKKMLDRISERTQKTTTVKFDRRRAAIDSDSE
uniref:Programmed cell death protein 5 n=1 Tax=Acrobeloides nanus TaxID=290746 RepID=A0A914E7G3_9BILA